jgi:hypothetical protein
MSFVDKSHGPHDTPMNLNIKASKILGWKLNKKVKDGNESLKGEKQIWKNPKSRLDIPNVRCVFACCTF